MNLSVLADNGALGSLGEDDNTRPLLVDLGQSTGLLGDFLQVLSPSILLPESSTLNLVTEEDVTVGKNLLERLPEEVDEEVSRDVPEERL